MSREAASENKSSKTQEARASHRWSEVCPEFEKLFDSTDLTIQTLGEMDTPAKILIEDMYFEGADILHCAEGRFRFSVKDMEPVVLSAGEMIVIYPGHCVTIEALGARNRLLYGIFCGASVESYLSSCGLYDGVHGKAASQYGSFCELRRLVEARAMDERKGRRICLGLLHDMIRTMKDELRKHGDTLLFDAIKQIRENLKVRVAHVDDLCKSLGTSRSHLTKVFRQNGLPTPADYIRSEQLNMAKALLSGSRLSISEIAYRLGFKTSSHFNQFVRRLTGVKPGDLRRG